MSEQNKYNSLGNIKLACTIKYAFRMLTGNLKYSMLYILNEDVTIPRRILI